MTTTLIAPLNDSMIDYANPANKERFFTDSEYRDFLRSYEQREKTPILPPYYGCTTNLFLGFFFDGTRNNYAASLKRKDHSATNVARLYEAYPGQSVAGVLPSSVEWPGKEQFKNFFRVYVPGVGTPLFFSALPFITQNI